MPSLATLVSRAAARYLGAIGPGVAREVARAARRELEHAPGSTAVAARPDPASRSARAAYAAWLVALGLFVLVVLNIDFLAPQRATAVFRLVVGAVLLSEGAALLPRRSAFRTALIARLTAASRRHPDRLRRSARKHAVGSGLTLLGLVWIAVGTLDLLRGLQTLL